MYHFDHFMGMFNTRLGELLNARSFTIGSTTALPGEPETVAVRVEVQGPQPAAPPAAFEFQLRRKLVGPRKGAWTVHSLTRAEG